MNLRRKAAHTLRAKRERQLKRAVIEFQLKRTPGDSGPRSWPRGPISVLQCLAYISCMIWTVTTSPPQIRFGMIGSGPNWT
jgi:hypothetical protein